MLIMKKLNLLLLVSLFAAAFTLTACGGDDETTTTPPPAQTNPLLGIWEHNGNGAFGDGLDVFTHYYFNITADGKVLFDYKMYARRGPSQATELHNAYQLTGTWTVQDNTITVNYTNRTWINVTDGSAGRTDDCNNTFSYTYRIENDKLLLTGNDDTNGGQWVDCVFVKKP